MDHWHRNLLPDDNLLHPHLVLDVLELRTVFESVGWRLALISLRSFTHPLALIFLWFFTYPLALTNVLMSITGAKVR